MLHAIRNLGRPGIVQMAIASVDAALWDLKARLLGLPLAKLLGMARDEVVLYGSGGFTSYTEAELVEQLGGWAAQGFERVKMKVGREPAKDLDRVRGVRRAVGPGPQIFVDANGAYSRKQALALAAGYADLGVRWFEEPVSSDDLPGLRLIRNRAPAGMDIAAGEYGYTGFYFRRMLDAGAVDVLQACAVQRFAHCEYFHDHVRIERMLFDGVVSPRGGTLRPDLGRPGMGLELRRADAERFRV
jgi:L-alanine-DL-glutamate epimerase-like enolase superfamily enzyme